MLHAVLCIQIGAVVCIQQVPCPGRQRSVIDRSCVLHTCIVGSNTRTPLTSSELVQWRAAVPAFCTWPRHLWSACMLAAATPASVQQQPAHNRQVKCTAAKHPSPPQLEACETNQVLYELGKSSVQLKVWTDYTTPRGQASKHVHIKLTEQGCRTAFVQRVTLSIRFSTEQLYDMC